MDIGGVRIGQGAPLALVAGLNVIEGEAETLEAARAIQTIAERHRLPVVFKASFDKANRSSVSSFRGPGLDLGLRILETVKQETGLPLLTDVHEPGQAKIVAEVVDCLQVPAFLCRQTDLIAACAATGRPLNIKKGQFMAPVDMRLAVEKARSFGASGVFVTERGTSFGYNQLIVDMRGLVQMREFVPVCFDATHAVQHPGAGEDAADGDREMVLPLARAAVAIGIDALFVEAHQAPDRAPCDGPSQIDFTTLDLLAGEVCTIARAAASPGAASTD